ncbi:MAG: tetratricopeptide repeat protein [Elusimicrobiota bacterium]
MKKKHISISILILILSGFLLYSNTLKNPFVWDDGLFIQNGNFIKKFENTWVFFSPKNYFKYTQDFTYRPLPFLIHIANYKIWGTNPIGHRLTNIFLHIANGILLYFLILYLLKNNFIAFLSALFFVVHPVNTEVVHMVSFVETQLSTIFFLLSFFCYIKSKERLSRADKSTLTMTAENDVIARRSRSNLYIFSVASFFLSVFCKETAITLPAIMILYDLMRNVTAKNVGTVFDRARYQHEHSSCLLTGHVGTVFDRAKCLKKYLPFLAVTIFYLIVRFFLFRHPAETMIKYPVDSFITNIFVMLKAIPVYFGLIFFPFNLSVEHKITVPHSFFETSVVLGFLAIIIFAIISIYTYKKSKKNENRPDTFFWLIFSAITFIPTSNIVPMQNIVAERYLYLPIIGMCVLLVLLFEKCSATIYSGFNVVRPFMVASSTEAKSAVTLKYGIAGCVIIFFSAITTIRNRDWKDEITFYSKTLSQNPTSPGANLNMVAMYKKGGDYKKALEFVNKAIAIDPDYLDNNFALASIYQDSGDYDKAFVLYEKMVAEKKYTIHKAPFLNLGIIYKIKKQYQKAIENFNKAIEIYPLSSVAYAHLAEISEVQEDVYKTEKYYEKSVDVNPDDYIPLNALGIIYGQKGELDKSLKYLKRAVRIKSDSADIHFNIGYIYFLTYEYGMALNEMETTLKLDPNYERAKFIISQITGKKL